MKTGGTVACWGWSNYGQGTAPTGNFTSISAGGYHNCGVKTDGTGSCWGLASSGQLSVPSGTTFLSISAGGAHQLRDQDGWQRCLLGLEQQWPGAIARRREPSRALSAGAINTCGVKSDGTLACWGDNAYGESSPPTGTFTSVAADAYSACGVKTGGTVACWGDNSNGQNSPNTSSYRMVSAGAYPFLPDQERWNSGLLGQQQLW